VYSPFGYSNLEIGYIWTFVRCVQSIWILEIREFQSGTLRTFPLEIATWILEISTSLYSPIGNRKFGSLYWDIQSLRLFEFGNLYFCTFVRLRTFPLEIATWIFGIFYFVIQSNWKLEIGSLGVCTLTYNPFGYSNLEIGNFGLLYFCTLVLLRTVPLEIRFSEIGGFGIVLSVQSEPNQYTRVDVAGGIDCYRLGYTNRT